MKLFVKHKSVKWLMFLSVGVAYVFALAALIHAVRWW